GALLEVALPHLGRRDPEGAFAIHPAARSDHVGAAQVAPDDVDLPPIEQPRLQNEDRQGVDLLTRGAARAPYVQAALGGVGSDDPGQQLFLESTELVLLPEEVGLLG